jgi:glucokinase
MSTDHPTVFGPKAAAVPIIGIDIGGTKCAVLIGSPEGKILHKVIFPTDTAGGLENTLQRLWKTMEQVVTRAGGGEPVFGVSCGGPLNSREGLILSPPNLPGWDHVPITRLITDRFGGRAFLMNDANASALAEWKWGAARGTQDAIFLTFGTGMGAGIIIGGRIHAGRDDLAGEVGHVRMADDGPVGFGKAGSFEGFCSGGGITRLAQNRIQAAWQKGEQISFCADEEARTRLELRTVAEAARHGDAFAREVFETSAYYLGRGLALLMDILNPEVIVIGSVFARCEDLLRPTAMRVLAAEALPAAVQRCKIVPAGLGEAIGDYAALAVAYAGLSGELGHG